MRPFFQEIQEIIGTTPAFLLHDAAWISACVSEAMILGVFKQHAERCGLRVNLRHKPHAYLIAEASRRVELLRSSPSFERTRQCAWMQEITVAAQAQSSARRGALGAFVPAMPAHAIPICVSHKRRRM